MLKSCFLDLLDLTHECNMSNWVGRTRSTNNLKKIFVNAFIIAMLNSHSELTLTSFSVLFEKTQIIIWNSKILKTKRDGETAIF